MTESMDKPERARFLAVQRLRRYDDYAAEVLDNALLIQAVADGAVTVHCPMTPEGDPLDLEVGEISLNQVESASEEDLADMIAGFIRTALNEGVIPRFHDMPPK